jgi:pimeloyl-ACP methyl ester carboxylesterase
MISGVTLESFMKSLMSALILFLSVGYAHAGTPTSAKNIVIVHGAFADGSGWEGVARILANDGYNVTIVQNPTVSLASDVNATKNALLEQKGPVVLVGHSYGGEVITQAGNDPKVKSLVYVAAFVPDAGESLQSLSARPEFAPGPPVLPPSNGFLVLDRAKFAEAFAADVARDKARFLAAAQVPLALQTFTDPITTVAWKTKPSYYILTSRDRMIPPAAQKMMATRAKSVQVEIKGASHAVYLSQPEKVAKVIERAAAE